ncbi:zinc-dependent alcohol dehydrogenase family protein [Stratiformator vulcanicus]|uniref:Alcohol dehydrogenase n=1 Tax=Stratiformator vulcanicus TaxID=2527980 RepID=A0A517R7F4_9PLAN|nr:zinc-dependent alcohol dehydrogenase family protein [Stratiformator vulcanicus]QDT39805.1 Alcohol dehydrogenase [Stratiformator vulcanicus]
MKAVSFDRFGEPADVLEVRDVPTPEPSEGSVLVRMLASPINPSDLMTVRGTYALKPELPATPGYEGVGIVESSNAGLYGKFLSGKRVAVLNGSGGNWAEYATVPAKRAVPIPTDLPLAQAAMFFVNPATAYVMSRQVLGVSQGEWLLQSAAGSSLGRMIIALGKHYGFRTLNVVRRDEQAEELRELGGDAVIVFDGAHDDPDGFPEQAVAAVDGKPVRFAIDPVGGATGTALLKALGDGGRLLAYGTLAGEPISVNARDLLTHGSKVEGFWLARWMESQSLWGRLSVIRKVSKLLGEGIIQSDVGQSFSMTEIREAVKKSEERGRGGKAWLKFGE